MYMLLFFLVAVRCDKLEAPEKGKISYSRGLYFNSISTSSCRSGYVLDRASGNKTRRCQSFGEWTGEAPKCISK